MGKYQVIYADPRGHIGFGVKKETGDQRKATTQP